MTKFPFRVVETAPPATEPVLLQGAKSYLRVSHDNDDDQIEALISAARVACEGFTSRAFVSRELSVFLDRWPVIGETSDEGLAQEHGMIFTPAPLSLPRAPLMGVEAVRIYDADGISGELELSLFDIDTVSGRIALKAGTPPPVPGRDMNGIEICYIAGYGDADDVPAALKQAILQLTAQFYENRGDSDAFRKSGAADLLQPYRIMSL